MFTSVFSFSISVFFPFILDKPIHLTNISFVICKSCQYEHVFNSFPNKPWFSCVCSISHLKKLQEKEKLLVTSNFSFSHSVFYPFGELLTIFIKFIIDVFKLFQFGRVQNLSLGKGLILCSGTSSINVACTIYR